MSESELFLQVLDAAEEYLDTPGEDLRKQALALLIAANAQHRANVEAWLAVLTSDRSEPRSVEDRFDDALHLLVAQRDAGQLEMLIEWILGMDFDVALEPRLTRSTFKLLRQEAQASLDQENSKSNSEIIERLNRLMGD
jgi:phage gp37-like protein